MSRLKKILLLLFLVPLIFLLSIIAILTFKGKELTEIAVNEVGKKFIAPAINVSLLTQLFSTNFEDKDSALRYINILKNRKFGEDQVSTLLEFLKIKLEIEKFNSKNDRLPVNLSEMLLPDELFVDKWGNSYRYFVKDGLILLGCTGPNGIWDLSEDSKELIIKNMYEFVFSFQDDLIIKILLNNS